MNSSLGELSSRAVFSDVTVISLWGRPGFDVGCEAVRAYRGSGYLVNPSDKKIVANDESYALAA